MHFPEPTWHIIAFVFAVYVADHALPKAFEIVGEDLHSGYNCVMQDSAFADAPIQIGVSRLQHDDGSRTRFLIDQINETLGQHGANAKELCALDLKRFIPGLRRDAAPDVVISGDVLGDQMVLTLAAGGVRHRRPYSLDTMLGGDKLAEDLGASILEGMYLTARSAASGKLLDAQRQIERLMDESWFTSRDHACKLLAAHVVVAVRLGNASLGRRSFERLLTAEKCEVPPVVIGDLSEALENLAARVRDPETQKESWKAAALGFQQIARNENVARAVAAVAKYKAGHALLKLYTLDPTDRTRIEEAVKVLAEAFNDDALPDSSRADTLADYERAKAQLEAVMQSPQHAALPGGELTRAAPARGSQAIKDHRAPPKRHIRIPRCHKNHVSSPLRARWCAFTVFKRGEPRECVARSGKRYYVRRIYQSRPR
jgi:hypothetical protein